MKKVMFLMAVAGMFAFAACNSKNAEAPAADTMAAPVEEAVQAPVEEVVDSAAMPMENAAAATEDVAK